MHPFWYSTIPRFLQLWDSSTLNVSSKLNFFPLCFFALIQFDLRALNLKLIFSLTCCISYIVLVKCLCFTMITMSSAYALQKKFSNYFIWIHFVKSFFLFNIIFIVGIISHLKSKIPWEKSFKKSKTLIKIPFNYLFDYIYIIY